MIVLDSITDPKLAELLRTGRLGVMPTDTIYGLAVRAMDSRAVARLSQVKRASGRYRPGTVIAANTQQLIELGIDAGVIKQVVHLWPNPLSIELPLGEQLSYLHQEGPHRAFRVVADERLRALLEKTGPLLTTSANLHGQPAANTIQEARAYFGDSVDFYVEGGDLSGNAPSTVARLAEGRLEIVRPGAVNVSRN